MLDIRSTIIIIISLTICKPKVNERISLRTVIKDEKGYKKNCQKFDKKQLKKRATFYLHRVKHCSAFKFTTNVTLSVWKLQPQNNNINENNNQIK